MRAREEEREAQDLLQPQTQHLSLTEVCVAVRAGRTFAERYSISFVCVCGRVRVTVWGIKELCLLTTHPICIWYGVPCACLNHASMFVVR